MIQITIPEMKRLRYDEIKSVERGGGIYLIYNKEEKLMYVGKSCGLKERLYAHFKGHDPNTSQFKQHLYSCEYFLDSDVVNQDMYETYLINNLHPYINIGKTFTYSFLKNREIMRIKNVSKWDGEAKNHYSCQARTTNGHQCTRHPLDNSDYCKLHGGMMDKKAQ